MEKLENILNKSGIYKITFLQNKNLFYIGSSQDVRKRLIHHLSQLKNLKHQNKILLNYYKKYGIDNFKFDVVEYCDLEFLIVKEQYYIDNLNPFFNIRKIADRNTGVVQSEELKKRRSETRKGVKFSKEHCENISKSKKGKKLTYKKFNSPETRIKISNSNKGRLVSNETREKLSIAGSKRIHSKESIEKRILKVKGMKMTDIQKQKLSKAKSKIVYQYDKCFNLIEKYPSALIASNSTKILHTSICKVCRGIAKSAGGYIWSYIKIEKAKPLMS